MLEVSGITKRYGSKTAVDQISFKVNQGEIVGFLGTNGAGKSTTMNIITGYLSASEGSVTVDGFDVLTEPVKVKERIGYLPEIPPLYPDMTVWESLCFIYALKRVRLDRDAHLDEICALVKIEEMKQRLVKNLSKGYRQRVGLACALIGNPPILIFDEPTVGLDPKQIIEIRTLIQKLAQTRTVILSSHILQEISAVCKRIIIINKGRIVADDTPENLTAAQARDSRMLVQLPGEPAQVKTLLEGLDGVVSVEVGERVEPKVCRYLVDTAGVDLRRELFALLVGENLPLLELSFRQITLEDAFLALTREEQGTLQPDEPGEPTEQADDPVAPDDAQTKQEEENE